MENRSNLDGAYWILFYQPLPEVGERIAVAIIFEDGKRIFYDRNFNKVLKLYPSTDPKLMSYYIECIRMKFFEGLEITEIVDEFSPQFCLSKCKEISLPVSIDKISILMKRYLSVDESSLSDMEF